MSEANKGGCRGEEQLAASPRSASWCRFCGQESQIGMEDMRCFACHKKAFDDIIETTANALGQFGQVSAAVREALEQSLGLNS